jgi:hypothetical protein
MADTRGISHRACSMLRGGWQRRQQPLHKLGYPLREALRLWHESTPGDQAQDNARSNTAKQGPPKATPLRTYLRASGCGLRTKRPYEHFMVRGALSVRENV